MNSRTQILIIEDNKTNLDLMLYLLNAFGYAAISTTDGIAGIEVARREQPALIICDVHLPKLDGYGVVRELKGDKALREIPIVAVTALAMVGDRDRILSAGFDGYVGKPLAPETFVQDIEKFLSPELHSRVKPTIATATMAQSESVREPSDGGRGTVLVVDDLAENLEFARSTLQPSGYAVYTTNDVEHALILAGEKRPDLLLCDLHMQPYSGLDLLDRVRAESALDELPVVIISSTSTGIYEEAECRKRGAANFIRRPIEPQALLTEIAKTMDEARQR